MMQRQVSKLSWFFVLAVLGLLSSAVSAQSIELRLPDGSRWRGEVGDEVKLTIRERNVEIELEGHIVEAANLYLQIEGDFVGRRRTIFKSDILTIETIKEQDKKQGGNSPGKRTDRSNGESGTEEETDSDYSGPGVLVLPLNGMVGVGIRKEEIEAIGREADRLGPGQIIVLDIDTGGGLLMETFPIVEAMQRIKERHRLIAWVNPAAISAGCAIASVTRSTLLATARPAP